MIPPVSCPWLDWLLPRHAAVGGVTEVRVLRPEEDRQRIWSSYFEPEHRDALLAALQPVEGSPRTTIARGDHPRNGEAAFYFSLQAVRADVGPDRRGKLAPAKSTSKDADILAYTLFVVDVDPERPAGISATDAEKGAALDVVEAVRAWLAERGVKCLLADSGNGYHLLVPLTAYLGEDVKRAAKDAHDLLKLLAERFSTAGAKVDTATFNPSRILKLYGTRAVKGPDTPERPHRDSSVDLGSIPEDVDLFALVAADLEAFRARTAKPRAKAGAKRPSLSPRSGSGGASDAWSRWRSDAIAALPLDRVYGDLLTGKASEGWLQCRDPDSPSGDQTPSAGVADGSGEAERGAFHSFRTGETESVFDVLIRTGRATSFRAACDLVAELSGVSIPEQAGPSVDGAAVVGDVRRAWPSLPDDVGRLACLRDAIARLLPLRAAERDRFLKELRELAGMTAKVFDATVGEVRRDRREDARAAQPPTPPPAARRPVVDLIINRDTVAGFFDAVTAALAPFRRFFKYERDMVVVRRSEGPAVLHERNLPGCLSALMEIRFFKVDEDGLQFLRFGVLPQELARAFTADLRVLNSLPKLRYYCRSPLFDEAFRYVGRPGYHADAEIFYDGPLVEPRDGVDRLCEVLDGFHWKAEADQVNFVGALLTALTMPAWGRGHPFLAVNGNKPGVGKSTLTAVLAAIVEGAVPSTVSFISDDTEFEKQLATRVEAGDRVIVIDNAKHRGAIDSPVLERCITDTRINFRRLGSNTAITRPQNDILFCITMNLTTLGQDLRRRALPVNLVLEKDVRSTTYAHDDVVGFALEHRIEIVGELVGMVSRWLAASRPGCEAPARHSTSQRWASTIDAILRLSGFDGFLSNFEESSHAFDPRYDLVLEIAREHHGKPAANAAEWAELLAGNIMEDRFRDRNGNQKSARARATTMGSLFGEYLDERFVADGRRFRLVREYPEGEGRKPSYRFEEVAP